MKFSFVPPGMAAVPVPGVLANDGSQPHRICQRVKGGVWVSSAQPHSAEGREAMLLIRMAQRGDLLPADAETAKACGVPFRSLEWRGATEGWHASEPKITRASSSSSRRETSSKD